MGTSCMLYVQILIYGGTRCLLVYFWPKFLLRWCFYLSFWWVNLSYIVDKSLMCCLQLNHVFTTRDLVTKNDSKLAKRQERDDEEILNDDRFLDHGFNRPKVEYWLLFFFFCFCFGGDADWTQNGKKYIYFIDCTNYDTYMLFTFVLIMIHVYRLVLVFKIFYISVWLYVCTGP